MVKITAPEVCARIIWDKQSKIHDIFDRCINQNLLTTSKTDKATLTFNLPHLVSPTKTFPSPTRCFHPRHRICSLPHPRHCICFLPTHHPWLCGCLTRCWDLHQLRISLVPVEFSVISIPKQSKKITKKLQGKKTSGMKQDMKSENEEFYHVICEEGSSHLSHLSDVTCSSISAKRWTLCDFLSNIRSRASFAAFAGAAAIWGSTPPKSGEWTAPVEGKFDPAKPRCAICSAWASKSFCCSCCKCFRRPRSS